MTYVQVPVPEEHVPAALEFVLSRVRATTPVEPQPDASITPSAVDDADDQLPALVAAVSGEARVLLETVARMPDTRMNYEKLAEVSGVRNVGAALQSLKIQRTRLGLDSPIEKRRDSRANGRNVYWMTTPTAARVLRIIERDR